MHWLYLAIAILGEVVATSALKSAEGFTRLVPSSIVVLGYGIAFYFLSLALKTLSVGIAYAIWSGVGVVLVATIAYFLHGQSLNIPSLIGIGFIILGVCVLNIFSGGAH